jgi:hypothetical protein
MITPARLREIALRVETVCVEKRKYERRIKGEQATESGNMPCDGCHAAANELREMATELGPKKVQVIRELAVEAEPEEVA